jgi:uncharacterized protein (DUF1697 family)
MKRNFGFLRAVNVGGRRMLMTDMVAALAGANLQQVESFIASGNFTFVGAATERLVELELERKFGFRAEVFLRSHDELTALCASAEPLATLDSVQSVQIGFLRTEPDAAFCAQIGAFEGQLDRFTYGARELVWIAHGRVLDTPFGKRGMTSKQLPVITFRNLTTLRRMLTKWPNR